MSEIPQADGNKPEYSPWIHERYSDLHQVAAFYTGGDPHMTADVVQIVAVKIGRSWDNDDIREEIITNEAYLHTIVKNCFLTYRKIRSRIEGRECEFDPEQHNAIGDSPDLELRAAILSLPEKERSMILLHYYMGHSRTKAGAKLGLSRDQALRLHNKAIEKLKILLAVTE